jgi:hypothetical protein
MIPLSLESDIPTLSNQENVCVSIVVFSSELDSKFPFSSCKGLMQGLQVRQLIT